MKKAMIKTLMAPLLLTALLFPAVFGEGSGASSLQAAASLTGVVVEDVYSIGDVFSIDSNAKITKDGVDYPISNCSLIYPSGLAKSGSSFKLDAYGSYRVLFEAAGGEISLQDNFAVKKDYYSLGMSSSSIGYGELNKNFKDSGYPNGLKLNLAEGDRFVYEEPIDLYSADVYDLISWNVIQYTPVVHYVTIRLTDAYRAENYVEIVCKYGDYSYETYVAASANGLRSVGLEPDDGGAVTVLGQNYQISTYGGTGMPGNSDISLAYNNLTYSLDTTDHDHLRIYADTSAERQHSLISEINNARLYSGSFAGFTNGKVYLSIVATSFEGVETAPIQIGEIAGKSGKDLLPMDYYEDTEGPIFDLSVAEGDNQVMVGVPLRIPSAQALDDTAIRGSADYHVYYNYDGSGRSLVATENGAFTPEEYGIYTVIYEATDVFGNVGQARYDLFASVKGEAGIVFSVDELTGVHAGESVSLDACSAVSLNGNAKISLVLTSPSGSVASTELHSQVLLEEVGTYQVHYSYSDSFYSGEYDYSFSAAASTSSRFASDYIALPRYLIKGAAYSVDSIPAHSYTSSGVVATAVTAYASFDGGTYQPFDNGDFTVSGSKSFQMKYVAADNPSNYLESASVPIVDVGYGSTLDVSRYFTGSFTGSVPEDADYVAYTPDSEGTGSLNFINKILLNAFQLDFKAASVDSLTLTLTDFYDPAASISVTLLSDGAVSINGGDETALAGGWQNQRLLISYDSEAAKLNIGSASVAMDDVFEHDLCFLSLSMEGLTAASSLSVYQVCNQVFRSGIKRDKVAPTTSVSFPDKIAEIGDEAVVSRLYFADMLSPAPDSNATLTVRHSENGELSIVKDENGVLLEKISDFSSEHRISLDAYGMYLVSYQIKDGAGVEVYGGLTGTIKVNDDIAPTLKLLGYAGKPIEVAVNSDVTPLSVEASDNYTASADLEIWYLVFDSRGVYVTALQSGSFQLQKAGLYTVYVRCADAAGNLAYASYQVQAK